MHYFWYKHLMRITYRRLFFDSKNTELQVITMWTNSSRKVAHSNCVRVFPISVVVSMKICRRYYFWSTWYIQGVFLTFWKSSKEANCLFIQILMKIAIYVYIYINIYICIYIYFACVFVSSSSGFLSLM